MIMRLTDYASDEIKYAIYNSWYRVSNSLPRRRVLVNGSPKTGTTWMVYLLASLPGYRHVGNFRFDIQKYHTMEPGDVVHGHDRYGPELMDILRPNAIRTILMVRDPRDQIVSHMYHIKRDVTHSWHQRFMEMSDDETLMASIEGHPESESVPFLGGAEFWVTFAREWLNGAPEILTVKYEDLSLTPVDELGRVLHYLEVDTNQDLLETIVARNRFERLTVGWKFWRAGRKPGQENSTSHFRKGIVGDWRNHYKEAHIRRFKELAGEALIELGYEQDLDW